MSKAKGPKWGQTMEPNVEWREYTVTREDIEHKSSNVIYFDCPFCHHEVKAYVWSLCGGGKRCDCGAMFGSSGTAYHFNTSTRGVSHDQASKDQQSNP